MKAMWVILAENDTKTIGQRSERVIVLVFKSAFIDKYCTGEILSNLVAARMQVHVMLYFFNLNR